MSKADRHPEDPFIRVRSAFRIGNLVQPGIIRPVLSRLERVRPKRDFRFQPHQHLEFEIIFVVKGPYFCKLNGEDLKLSDDTVLLIEPGNWHEDYCRPPLDYGAFLFTLHGRGDGQHLPDLRFFKRETPISRRHASMRTALFLPLLDKIAQEVKINDALASNLQSALVEEFFWRIARAFGPKWLSSWLIPSQAKEIFMARLSAAMAKYPHESFSVPGLAQSLGLSQRALRMRCADLLGDSPAHLFLRFKIEQARKRLAEGEISVKEVSHMFGFSDPYHFSRAYKAVTGFSPSKTPVNVSVNHFFPS